MDVSLAEKSVDELVDSMAVCSVVNSAASWDAM